MHTITPSPPATAPPAVDRRGHRRRCCRNHHKFPSDIERLVFPPLPACLPAALIYGALRACLPQVRAPAQHCLWWLPPEVSIHLTPARHISLSHSPSHSVLLLFAGSCFCGVQRRAAGLCGIRLHALPDAQVRQPASQGCCRQHAWHAWHVWQLVSFRTLAALADLCFA